MYTKCSLYLPYIALTEATGKDGNCISSYQVKVQPPVRTTDFALDEQVASRDASWEIDSKASFPQAPYDDSTTNGTQTQSSSLHLVSLDECFLSSVVSAATPVVKLASKRVVGFKQRCDRQVKSCWLAQDPVWN